MEFIGAVRRNLTPWSPLHLKRWRGDQGVGFRGRLATSPSIRYTVMDTREPRSHLEQAPVINPRSTRARPCTLVHTRAHTCTLVRPDDPQ